MGAAGLGPRDAAQQRLGDRAGGGEQELARPAGAGRVAQDAALLADRERRGVERAVRLAGRGHGRGQRRAGGRRPRLQAVGARLGGDLHRAFEPALGRAS